MIHYHLKLIKEINHRENGIRVREGQIQKDRIQVDKI
jgi:hypothetical protein